MVLICSGVVYLFRFVDLTTKKYTKITTIIIRITKNKKALKFLIEYVFTITEKKSSKQAYGTF